MSVKKYEPIAVSKSFTIQISIDDGSASESVECEGEINYTFADNMYWAVRFAVDAFIAKSHLLPDERVSVSGIAMYRNWIVRTRTLRPANGKARTLFYGELS